jgi:protein TonB
MTPKRYVTFACLTALIQGGVIASQIKPSELRTAGVAMGSVQSINLTITTPTVQSSSPAAIPAVEKQLAKVKPPTAEPKTNPLSIVKKPPVAAKNVVPVSHTKSNEQLTAKQPANTKPLVADTKPQPVSDADTHAQQQQQQQRENQAKQGVAQTNIMLNRPTFSSPPSQPLYPKLARKRGFEGTVTVEVMFNQIGEQLSLTLIDSSGFSLLDKAALTAVEKWQFSAPSPQTAYAYTVRVPVKFALH